MLAVMQKTWIGSARCSIAAQTFTKILPPVWESWAASRIQPGGFFIEYQDRILFSTDFPVSVDTCRLHYLFLEIDDEYMNYSVSDPLIKSASGFMGCTCLMKSWKKYIIAMPKR